MLANLNLLNRRIPTRTSGGWEGISGRSADPSPDRRTARAPDKERLGPNWCQKKTSGVLAVDPVRFGRKRRIGPPLPLWPHTEE